jgi:hypothetical protein
MASSLIHFDSAAVVIVGQGENAQSSTAGLRLRRRWRRVSLVRKS